MDELQYATDMVTWTQLSYLGTHSYVPARGLAATWMEARAYAAREPKPFRCSAVFELVGKRIPCRRLGAIADWYYLCSSVGFMSI